MSNTRLSRTTAVAFPRSSKWRIAFALTLVFLCIAPVLWAQQNVRASLIKPSARAKAPAFQLTGESGANLKLSHYRGKVILLNFWATDCGGCVLEIPRLIDVERNFRHNDFTVVGVDMDIPYGGLKSASEAWKRVRPFMATHGMHYPVLMGNSAIEKLYGINAYPASFIIDKSGRIAAKYVGIVNSNNVEANVRTLLHNK
ncbi:MAG: TlpA family protein disulfide reductase [Candidatus Acidiferrales bacterium]